MHRHERALHGLTWYPDENSPSQSKEALDRARLVAACSKKNIMVCKNCYTEALQNVTMETIWLVSPERQYKVWCFDEGLFVRQVCPSSPPFLLEQVINLQLILWSQQSASAIHAFLSLAKDAKLTSLLELGRGYQTHFWF